VSDYVGIKASFGKMTQFLHLLSNSSLGLPTDLWVPSTNKIRPQESLQGVLGLDFRVGNLLDLQLEGYYKRMDHLIDYSEGAYVLNNWEENVTEGNGIAYGLDVHIRKKIGPIKGWVSYSFAHADRAFERINLGRRYPFQYDRRHDFKIVLQQKVKPWLELTANWIYSTGLPTNLPLQEYYFQVPGNPSTPVTVTDVGAKNQFRMPAYHRLDVNANFYFPGKIFDHKLQLGVYNLYNWKNLVYYDLEAELVNDGNQIESRERYVQVWLLPIIPSLSYSIKF